MVMKMRLIDADELLKWSDEAELTFDGGIDINVLEDKIDSMPTIDPVKQAHWKKTSLVNLGSRHLTGFWMCSNCRHTQRTQSVYCGGCGARMVGDKDG